MKIYPLGAKIGGRASPKIQPLHRCIAGLSDGFSLRIREVTLQQ